MKSDNKSAQIVVDGGLSQLPETLRMLVEYLALRADQLCVLDAGKTALYWHLVGVVGQHIRSTKPETKR